MRPNPLQSALDDAHVLVFKANRARERGQHRAEVRHLRAAVVRLCEAIADAARDNVIKLPVR
jgi:hypothetical protein